MQIKRMSEELRSKVGWIVFGVATLLIILIGAFFIVDGITRNPLEGEWSAEGKNQVLVIEDDGEMTISVVANGNQIKVNAKYQLNKDEKTIAVTPDLTSYKQASDQSAGALTEAEINEYLSLFKTSYDYSLDKNTLTLTEREYGEEMIFTRTK